MFVIGENGFDASLLSAVTQRIHRVSVVYWWASRLAGTRFSWLCGHGAKETAHVNGDAMIALMCHGGRGQRGCCHGNRSCARADWWVGRCGDWSVSQKTLRTLISIIIVKNRTFLLDYIKKIELLMCRVCVWLPLFLFISFISHKSRNIKTENNTNNNIIFFFFK